VFRNTLNSVATAQPVSDWGAGLTYDDTTTPTVSVLYYYWVKAATSDQGATPSAYNTISNSGYRGLAGATNVQAMDGTSAANVTVTWDPVANQPNYFYSVFRAENPDAVPVKLTASAWAKVTGAQGTFIDATAVVGKTYWYWVRASLAATGTWPGALSNADEGHRAPATRLAPADGQFAGETVTITGDSFGTIRGGGSVSFTANDRGSVNATVVSWTDTFIECLVPADCTTGAVRVTITTPAGITATTDYTIYPSPAGEWDVSYVSSDGAVAGTDHVSIFRKNGQYYLLDLQADRIGVLNAGESGSLSGLLYQLAGVKNASTVVTNVISTALSFDPGSQTADGFAGTLDDGSVIWRLAGTRSVSPDNGWAIANYLEPVLPIYQARLVSEKNDNLWQSAASAYFLSETTTAEIGLAVAVNGQEFVGPLSKPVASGSFALPATLPFTIWHGLVGIPDVPGITSAEPCRVTFTCDTGTSSSAVTEIIEPPTVSLDSPASGSSWDITAAPQLTFTVAALGSAVPGVTTVTVFWGLASAVTVEPDFAAELNDGVPLLGQHRVVVPQAAVFASGDYQWGVRFGPENAGLNRLWQEFSFITTVNLISPR